MPIEPEYTLQELAAITGVTPRTVRYYISVGLLPAPAQAGPNTRYGEDVLRRVRLIRRLQDQHLPLAEIRARLEGLDDTDVIAALDSGPPGRRVQLRPRLHPVPDLPGRAVPDAGGAIDRRR